MSGPGSRLQALNTNHLASTARRSRTSNIETADSVPPVPICHTVNHLIRIRITTATTRAVAPRPHTTIMLYRTQTRHNTHLGFLAANADLPSCR